MPLSKLELIEFLTVTNYAIVNLGKAANLAIATIHRSGNKPVPVPGELGEFISDASRNVERMRKLSE